MQQTYIYMYIYKLFMHFEIRYTMQIHTCIYAFSRKIITKTVKNDDVIGKYIQQSSSWLIKNPFV